MEESMQGRAAMLKERKKRCCCKFCGGELSIKRIVFSNFEDARLELYCDYCDRIEFGVEPEIYHCAENFVDQLNYNFFEDMDDNAMRRQMNVAKICEIMAWSYRYMGLVDQNGFTVPIAHDPNHWDECLTLRDADLDQESETMDHGTDH
ncbi:MAG: hypothetical protein UDB11_09885 [Peptococcaceae bacterium]|nr:hypothetical protein [Peptococcaceae bacterium]